MPPLLFEHLKTHARLFDAHASGPLANGPAHLFIIGPAIGARIGAGRGVVFHRRSSRKIFVVPSMYCTIPHKGSRRL